MFDTRAGVSVLDSSPTKQMVNGIVVARFDPSMLVQFLTLSGAGLDLFRDIDGLTIAIVFRGITTSDDYLLNASLGTSVGNRRVLVEANEGKVLSFSCSGNDDENEGNLVWDANVGPNTGAGDPVGAAVIAILVADIRSGNFVINIGAASSLGSSGLLGDIALLAIWQRALVEREQRLALEYCSGQFGTL